MADDLIVYPNDLCLEGSNEGLTGEFDGNPDRRSNLRLDCLGRICDLLCRWGFWSGVWSGLLWRRGSVEALFFLGFVNNGDWTWRQQRSFFLFLFLDRFGLRFLEDLLPMVQTGEAAFDVEYYGRRGRREAHDFEPSGPKFEAGADLKITGVLAIDTWMVVKRMKKKNEKKEKKKQDCVL